MKLINYKYNKIYSKKYKNINKLMIIKELKNMFIY